MAGVAGPADEAGDETGDEGEEGEGGEGGEEAGEAGCGVSLLSSGLWASEGGGGAWRCAELGEQEHFMRHVDLQLVAELGGVFAARGEP